MGMGMAWCEYFFGLGLGMRRVRRLGIGKGIPHILFVSFEEFLSSWHKSGCEGCRGVSWVLGLVFLDFLFSFRGFWVGRLAIFMM